MITSVGTKRTKYPDADTQEFLSLDEYLLIAVKAIKYFAPKVRIGLVNEMLKNEEAVSEVAHQMMIADWRYNQEGGMTRYNYRNNYAYWSIKCYASHKKRSKLPYHFDGSSFGFIIDKRQKHPIDLLINSEIKNSDIEECLTNGLLTQRESSIVRMYYYDDLTYQQIGEKIGLTRERIRQILNSAITKIKEELNAI